jgi:hypothetical protein
MQEDKDAQIIIDLMQQGQTASSAASIPPIPLKAPRALTSRNNVRVNVYGGAVVHQVNVHYHAKPLKEVLAQVKKEAREE